jgi:hypothetical protein
MNPREFTICLGVDKATIEQLRLSLPTWRKYRPEMWDMEWMVFFDRDQLRVSDVLGVFFAQGVNAARTWPVAWPAVDAPAYETQRERMLTPHVYVPAVLAKTQWMMKVDCDVIATSASPWLEDEWFAADADGFYNNVIASPWSFTKSKGGGGDICEWASRLEKWGDTFAPDRPRLGLAGCIEGRRILYPRFTSWCSFYNTLWLRKLAESAKAFCGGEYKLPVPSQDSVAWYFAARRGDRWRAERMRRKGWHQCHGLAGLKEAAAKVLKCVT